MFKKNKSYAQKLRALELERTIKRLEKNPEKEQPLRKKRKKKPKKQITKWQKRYYEYLLSKEWTEIKIEMLIKYPECQRCGNKYQLQIHHKNYDHVFNEEPEDLEVLCKGCHIEEHKK